VALEPLLLLQEVREVCELADPQEPQLVSQRAFDNASQNSARFNGLPAAKNIAKALKLPWSEALKLAHEPVSVHPHHLSKKHHDPRQDWLTDEYIGFALNLVAQRLGATTVTPKKYRVERDALLAADRKRWLHGRQLLLPSEDAIRSAAGTWDKALAIAGLAARPGVGRQDSAKYALPSTEVLDRCYAAHGVQPTYGELQVFARSNGIPWNARDHSSWNECIADWKAKRKANGLPVPAGLPPRDGRPDYTVDVGASLPGERKRKNSWLNAEDCIVCVLRYLEQLKPGQRSTLRDYEIWVSTRDDAPNPSSLEQHGGWEKVRQQAQERRQHNP
jgi:hypothetical protein